MTRIVILTVALALTSVGCDNTLNAARVVEPAVSKAIAKDMDKLQSESARLLNKAERAAKELSK